MCQVEGRCISIHRFGTIKLERLTGTRKGCRTSSSLCFFQLLFHRSLFIPLPPPTHCPSLPAVRFSHSASPQLPHHIFDISYHILRSARGSCCAVIESAVLYLVYIGLQPRFPILSWNSSQAWKSDCRKHLLLPHLFVIVGFRLSQIRIPYKFQGYRFLNKTFQLHFF
ncbi:hypothetical protein L873DRAFT_447594 [Choiromyces venosus 120613-1]|uniref:Uncharacterized protein n=1 Tax=Choiromyces venosus 120613-1 TaxID=1336337 RepID=A0A3N4JYZ2_9PEZI|nr:hypothetical protein L873DRAFT_447594 [Choiromyces venosus 120613-1]